jgi:YgiT-type zinc finger domain-containing protein
MQCFECDGQYDKILEVYESDTKYGRLIVTDIEALVCNSCGDRVYGDAAFMKIDEATDKLRKAKQSDDSIMNSSFGWM